MEDVELNGFKYRIGRLDARKQFHVARRLAPIIATMAEASAAITAPPEGTSEEKNAENWFKKISGPLAEAFAEMPDETADYIINTCLGVVGREQGAGAYAPVLSKQNQLMFMDIDMTVMIGLTMQVVQENLAGFFSSGRQPSPQANSAVASHS